MSGAQVQDSVRKPAPRLIGNGAGERRPVGEIAAIE